MKRLYWRAENIILAFIQMLYWIYTGCELYSKDMASCGNTLGCIWRWRMAKADWRAGIAPSEHVALHRRLGKTLWAKQRKRPKKRFAHAEMQLDELRRGAECLADDLTRGIIV